MSLTKEQWVDILNDKSITNQTNISTLQIMYSFEGYKAPANQIALILGYKGKKPWSKLNLEIGRWGNRLAKKYNLELSNRENGTERRWDLFFDGWYEKQYFIWKLKEALKDTLEELNLTGEQQFSEEIPTTYQKILIEGAKRTITVNSYERNARARQLCIEHYGLKCQISDFDFEKTYGDIGKNFIHVHHLTKMADIKEKYEVDPIKHLRVVCPNCHAMLHRQESAFTIEELKEKLNK